VATGTGAYIYIYIYIWYFVRWLCSIFKCLFVVLTDSHKVFILQLASAVGAVLTSSGTILNISTNIKNRN